jgi:PrcB C-terminal
MGDDHPVAWRDVTHSFGRLEYVHKSLGVYHSRGSFERAIAQVMPGRAPRPPRLNWNRDQVVVIALGPRSSTGYSLRIQRVVERRRGIYIYGRELAPSLGESVTAKVTYPYRVLAMHGSAKPVYVKLAGRP